MENHRLPLTWYNKKSHLGVANSVVMVQGNSVHVVTDHGTHLSQNGDGNNIPLNVSESSKESVQKQNNTITLI